MAPVCRWSAALTSMSSIGLTTMRTKRAAYSPPWSRGVEPPEGARKATWMRSGPGDPLSKAANKWGCNWRARHTATPPGYQRLFWTKPN
jgi:hypothetical protein